jgi:hypothetical protein
MSLLNRRNFSIGKAQRANAPMDANLTPLEFPTDRLFRCSLRMPDPNPPCEQFWNSHVAVGPEKQMRKNIDWLAG